MESQPQNPEFRNNPENFHPCIGLSVWDFLYVFFWRDFFSLRGQLKLDSIL